MEDVGKLEKILEPVIEDLGMEIVDLDFLAEKGGRVLRLFVDWIDGTGVTVEDCARVSRDCGAVLDVEDVVAGTYRLEVSSPGIERRLRKRGHFDRQLGERIHVVLRQAIDGRRKLTGTLKETLDDAISVEASDGEIVVVPLAAIRRANLKVF